jgi:uncharacterized protein (TIGR02599 family)
MIPPLHRSAGGRLSSPSGGFTLIEMLVSTVILLFIMGIVFSMTEQTSSIWKGTSNKIESFRNARAAFEAMTRTISQATLNTYYDYQDSSGNWASISGNPAVTYARRSDLQFICGQGSTLIGSSYANGSSTYTPVTHSLFFQAPLGWSSVYTSQQRLLNACGFYVVYGPDPSVPPYLSGLSPRNRYRLMQFLQPSENLAVYANPAATTWFTQPISGTYDPSSNFTLADNVIALVIWPKNSAGDQTTSTSLTSNYSYDSRSNAKNNLTFNQLPPIVEVTMVSIDEASAIRLGNPTAAPNSSVGLTSALFTTATYPSSGQNQLQLDLATMESTLNAAHLNYHVFQTEVAIGGAKWSQ